MVAIGSSRMVSSNEASPKSISSEVDASSAACLISTTCSQLEQLHTQLFRKRAACAVYDHELLNLCSNHNTAS